MNAPAALAPFSFRKSKRTDGRTECMVYSEDMLIRNKLTCRLVVCHAIWKVSGVFFLLMRLMARLKTTTEMYIAKCSEFVFWEPLLLLRLGLTKSFKTYYEHHQGWDSETNVFLWYAEEYKQIIPPPWYKGGGGRWTSSRGFLLCCSLVRYQATITTF